MKKPLSPDRAAGAETENFLFYHSHATPPLSIISRRSIRRIRRISSRIRAAGNAPSKIMAVSMLLNFVKICLSIVKKIPEHLLFRESVSIIYHLDQPHNGTAYSSGISSSPIIVIRLIRSCFILIFTPFLRIFD